MKIVPRNSHEPSSRLTRLVCLPCQPMPAASASGFSMTGAVSTNTFTSPPARDDQLAGDALELALDQVVIVAVLRVDRNRAPLLLVEHVQRIVRRPVIHREHDDRAHIRPQHARIARAAPASPASSPWSRGALVLRIRTVFRQRAGSNRGTSPRPGRSRQALPRVR